MRVEFAAQHTALDDDQLLKAFKKECRTRHNMRTDIKSREFKRARELTWEQLIGEIMTEKSTTRTQARLELVRRMKATARDIAQSFCENSFLRKRFQEIMTSRKQAMKEEAAQSPPGPNPSPAPTPSPNLGEALPASEPCGPIPGEGKGSGPGEGEDQWQPPTHEDIDIILGQPLGRMC